ncbi:hypothetical protein [Haloarcula rubripromontorii]|uniref:Uncharacterized protein n=1 Tax=Haloarcula rubripromontorii TaxID=1705562 RepID=A0A0M9AKK5_9EURY|nr:hypothetical protein [Haloarcula rubripromontorii]KOX93939.1 hypothetical protein AMS69_08465 [Haloarcula rubripromontorii]NLV05847.1 hypothetical protein [Haloarcula rubripromontorii]
MDRRTTKLLRGTAATLVFATAAFHLWWGLPRSIIYAQAIEGLFGRGLPPDPRPFLFVAFAAVLLAGPYLITRGIVGLRNAYIAGTVLMIASIAGWVFWHATGHGAFLVDGFSAPSSGGGGHHHGGSTALLILDHFTTEPVESAIKTIEAFAVTIFVTLLWKDPAIIPGERRENVESNASSES